ncbi:hypothetical protein ABFU26_10995 [Xanthomonas campestris pv. raphani]|uniref:hypothetical protein n=1 Tax=Xanthomonas campestris TaxID=339 RepID=UPI003890F7EE
MTAGMKVWAQDGSGVLQIDNKYQNLFVRQKISAQSDFVEVANFSSGRFIDVRCLAFPVVAVGNSFPVSVEITQLGAQSYRIKFTMPGAVGTVFDAWVFDILDTADTSKYGLVVRDQNGRVIFDAVKKPMRVVGLFPATGENGGFLDVAAGRKYAVACTSGFYTKNIGAPQFGYFRYGGVLSSPTRPAIGNFQSGFQNTTTEYGADRPSMGIAIDVSYY